MQKVGLAKQISVQNKKHLAGLLLLCILHSRKNIHTQQYFSGTTQLSVLQTLDLELIFHS